MAGRPRIPRHSVAMTRELLDALRGPESKSAFARRLGVTYQHLAHVYATGATETLMGDWIQRLQGESP